MVNGPSTKKKMQNKTKQKIEQVSDAIPDKAYAGIKEDVDRGYKKFLEKRNMAPREPFAYGKNLGNFKRVDKDK